MPSCASFIQVSTETLGLRNSFLAESLTRAQCSSKSGVTPSKARAPSNTTEQSQAACVREPMIGALPSRHSFSKKVQVFDQFVAAAIPSAPMPSSLQATLLIESRLGPRVADGGVDGLSERRCKMHYERLDQHARRIDWKQDHLLAALRQVRPPHLGFI